MRKFTFIFAILIASSITSYGTETAVHYDSLYTLGNQAYQNKNYEEALSAYNSILESGVSSADLYYNLGNTFYKLQNTPEAILNFEKALKLKPGEPDYQYNLNLANKLIVDKIESLPTPFYKEWWNSFTNSLSIDLWAYLSIAFIAISLISFLMFLMSSTPIIKRLSFYLFIILIVGSGITYLFAKSQYHQNFVTQHAILFSTRASIYSEPNTSSTVLFVVHEGLKVQVLVSENKWFKIRLPDGSIGWIPEESVQFI